VLTGQRQSGKANSVSKAKTAIAEDWAAIALTAAPVGLDVNRLRQTIAYLSYLYAEGEISDRAFEVLVNYACSMFIDQEVERRIQNLLAEKLTRLQR